MAKMNLTQVLLIVVVLGGAYLFLGGKIPTLSVAPTGVSTSTQGIVTPIVCDSATAPVFTISAFQEFARGTQIRDINAYLYLDGVYSGRAENSTTETLTGIAGKGYKIFFSNANNTTYYGTTAEGQVPCDTQVPINVYVGLEGVGTVTYYNDGNGATNTVTTRQIINTGQSVTGRLRLQETTASSTINGNGLKKPALIVVDANVQGTPDFDLGVRAGGIGTNVVVAPSGIKIVKGGGTPAGYTSLDVNATAGVATFLIEGLGSISNFGYVDFDLTIHGSTINDPGISEAGAAGAGIDLDGATAVQVYYSQLVRNTVSNEWVYAYRNPVTNAALIAPDTTLIRLI